jgi:hypothetical protein
MTINDMRTAPPGGALAAAADSPRRSLAEIVAAALAVGCTIPSCAAQPGTACVSAGGVHLARISLACRARHVTGQEFASVILAATSPVFRPGTLIRPEVTR